MFRIERKYGAIKFAFMPNMVTIWPILGKRMGAK
jgi:hypothetical protein